MSELVLTTYDWVPPPPRGLVRDIRVRWALEEAKLPYRVATTPFDTREQAHLAHQPFAQVPWLTDGDLSVFESGAILLYLGEKSEALMPRDACGRSETIEWLFAALNSVEMASLPWVMFNFLGFKEEKGGEWLNNFVTLRMDRMEPVLADREWLVGDRFSVADIMMADVFRAADRFDRLAAHPACKAYMTRATARPAFVKALADQMAHFAAGDAAR